MLSERQKEILLSEENTNRKPKLKWLWVTVAAILKSPHPWHLRFIVVQETKYFNSNVQRYSKPNLSFTMEKHQLKCLFMSWGENCTDLKSKLNISRNLSRLPCDFLQLIFNDRHIIKDQKKRKKDLEDERLSGRALVMRFKMFLLL